MSRKWNLFSTYGKVRPGNAYFVAVINLLAARRGDQSPLKWQSHLSFCKGMEQPLEVPPTSPIREERGPQASRPYGMPLAQWRLFARTSSVEQELEPQKIEKCRVRPCLLGQVTVSEQIMSLANPAHSGRSTQRTHGTNWPYQAHTSKSTAPRKEMCHSGKPVPNGTKSAVSWLMRRT